MTVKTSSTSNEKTPENLTGDEMLKIIMKRLEKMNEEVLAKQENQEQTLKSIQNELKELMKNLECRDVESVEVTIPEYSKNYQFSKASFTPSKFVVRMVLKNISNKQKYDYSESNSEEYFGVKWYTTLYFEDDSIDISLDFEEICGYHSIDADVELSIVHPTGTTYSKKTEGEFDSHGQLLISDFIDRNEMEEDYMVDDKLIVEARVNIRNMKGVYKDDLRCFDESMKELSDVVLIVKERKFFVLKKYLATHSSYFKALFLGQFNESKKTEVVLSGIDAFDFQNYLEVLYGDYAIDEMTVEGILLVGDMYDTEIVTRKCEEFLMEKSKKLMKKKLQLSVRYNLEKLKKKCLSDIKTAEDIRSVIPGDINDLDPSIMAVLFEKSLSFK